MLQGESEEERGGSEEVKQNRGREDTDAGKMTDRAVLEETGGRWEGKEGGHIEWSREK